MAGSVPALIRFKAECSSVPYGAFHPDGEEETSPPMTSTTSRPFPGRSAHPRMNDIMKRSVARAVSRTIAASPAQLRGELQSAHLDRFLTQKPRKRESRTYRRSEPPLSRG